MFITGKNYHLGYKTFWFFFITHNKVLLAIFVGTLFISYQIQYGIFLPGVSGWLANNYSYVDISMVAMWLWMIIGSFVAILFLRTSVLYKQYSFVLHKHALHVKHGLFLVREHVMPYHQIINVEINRPYLYAPLGLVQLDIITGQSAEVDQQIYKNKKHQHSKQSILPVLDKKLARALSHELMRRSVGEHRKGENVGADETNISRRRRR